MSREAARPVWSGGGDCLGQSSKVTLGRGVPNGNLMISPDAPVGSLWTREQVCSAHYSTLINKVPGDTRIS